MLYLINYPFVSMNSIMILGLSFVLSFSVPTPFLMLMRDSWTNASFVCFKTTVCVKVGRFRKMGVIWNGVVPAASESMITNARFACSQ